MLLGKSFGSDNHSGVHPELMQALVDADVRHQPAYGVDRLTQGVGYFE